MTRANGHLVSAHPEYALGQAGAVANPEAGSPRTEVWTRPIAWTLATSVALVVVAVVLIPIHDSSVEGIALASMLLGVLGLIVVDNTVIHRANRGAPWFEMIANSHQLHRRAYHWSGIRAALRGR